MSDEMNGLKLALDAEVSSETQEVTPEVVVDTPDAPEGPSQGLQEIQDVPVGPGVLSWTGPGHGLQIHVLVPDEQLSFALNSVNVVAAAIKQADGVLMLVNNQKVNVVEETDKVDTSKGE